MKIHPTAYYLVIGTHGRSMYKIDMNQVVGIDPNETGIAGNFSLAQNYPNPFNPETKIKFSISENMSSGMSKVRVIVYDVIGHEIATLVNQELAAGNHEITFHGGNLSTGIYFYKLEIHSNSGNVFTGVRKMMLIK